MDKILFLVVFHAEGDSPISKMVVAHDGDEAWETVEKEYLESQGLEDGETELYLDHVKEVRGMMENAGATDIHFEAR